MKQHSYYSYAIVAIDHPIHVLAGKAGIICYTYRRYAVLPGH